MWQCLQISHIPCHKHIEHERLTDACTVCGDVYNINAKIINHVFKHLAAVAFDLYLVRTMSSGRATILKHMTAENVHALHWMWQRLQLSQILQHNHM